MVLVGWVGDDTCDTIVVFCAHMQALIYQLWDQIVIIPPNYIISGPLQESAQCTIITNDYGLHNKTYTVTFTNINPD